VHKYPFLEIFPTKISKVAYTGVLFLTQLAMAETYHMFSALSTYTLVSLVYLATLALLFNVGLSPPGARELELNGIVHALNLSPAPNLDGL
jgi:hypothetical protein